MTNEEERTTLLSKIDYVLGGINDASSRDTDLKIAQTVQALSEAYKNLRGEEE